MNKEWLSESALKKQEEKKVRTDIYIKQAGRWDAHTLFLTKEQIEKRKALLDEQVDKKKIDDYCIDPLTPPSN
jgi:hypothetical protein